MAEHEYTYNDIEGRLRAAHGKTLGEIDTAGNFPCAKKITGIAGDVVESSILGYKRDPKQEPDVRVDGIPWEVKTTGVILDKRKDAQPCMPYRAKERLTITAVSPDRLINEQFPDSHFWEKASHILLIWYVYNHGSAEKVPDANMYSAFELADHIWWDEWTKEDIAALRSDWEAVRDAIIERLSEGMSRDEAFSVITKVKTFYLDNAPAYKVKPRRQNPRFGLKSSVVDTMFKRHYGKRPFERLGYSSYSDIERKCHELRDEFGGMTVAEIAAALGYAGNLASKQASEAIVVRMLGGKSRKMGQIESFAAAGIRCKSITLTAKGAKTEELKFCRFDFDEAADPGMAWEDTQACQWFSGRILWVVFEEPSRDAPLADNVFVGFKWMPADDEDAMRSLARATWLECRDLIMTGRLTNTVRRKKDGTVRYNPKSKTISYMTNLPKSKTHIVYVKGTGSDARGKSELVNGLRLYVHNYWIRGDWMARSVNSAPLI